MRAHTHTHTHKSYQTVHSKADRIYSGDDNTYALQIPYQAASSVNQEISKKKKRPLNTRNRQHKVHAPIPVAFLLKVTSGPHF